MLANVGNPADQAIVEIGIAPHDVVDTVGAFEQARQYIVDIVDREGIVRPVDFDRPFLPGAAAVPGLLFGIPFAAKQDVFAVLAPRLQHHERVGLVESREIEEIAVLAKRVVRIAIADRLRRRRQNRDGVFSHHLHQLVTTAFELGSFHVVQVRFSSGTDSARRAG